MSFPDRACLLVIAICALLGAEAFGRSDGKPTIDLTIQAIQESVRSGLPVRIKVTLKNRSDHDIPVTREVRGRDCKVEVRDESGKLAPETSMGQVWNGHVSNLDPSRISPDNLKGALEYGTLKPGESAASEMDVATLYVLTKPGKYKIQLQREDPGNGSILVKSNTVTVTVTASAGRR